MHAVQKTACGFANTHGGKFLIGIDNGGRSVGIAEHDLDRMQQRLVQALRQLAPVPFYEMEVLDLEGKKILQVEIEPMMYGSMCSLEGIIYYRHGSVTERAEGATLQELLVKRKIIDFELTISRVGSEAVHVETLKEYLTLRSPTLPFDRGRIKNIL